ncbi:MAG: Aspartate aminotransferase [Firmicutes bacterium]|nr:Aspartate aminotransferase [Bacillota bacterium]MDI6705206.1 pyridoxal phosphate-dependent aminotransferase [Bacillota bacterium]
MANIISSNVLAVPHSSIRKMFNIASKLDGVINFGIGEPDFDTPGNILEAAKRAMDEGYTHYTANAGLIELREAIARKLERDNGIKADPVNGIIVTSGGMGALSLAMLTLVEKNDEVILPDPSWCNYTSHVILAGGKPVYVPLREENGFMLTAEDIEQRITPKSKVLLINSPANPTGAVINRDEMHKIAKLVKEYGLFIVTDEVYEKFTYDGAEHFSIASISSVADRTILINSFSKSYAMTGWRVGFAAGNSEIIGQMTKLQEHIVACVSTVSQKAAIEALEGPQDQLENMIEKYRARREILIDGLNRIAGIKCSKPKGSFYAFANIKSSGISSEEFALDLLKKKKVCLIPGTAFGESGEGYVRISYATSEENICEGLRRIEEYMNAIDR